jgi:hypothetical protein
VHASAPKTGMLTLRAACCGFVGVCCVLAGLGKSLSTVLCGADVADALCAHVHKLRGSAAFQTAAVVHM